MKENVLYDFLKIHGSEVNGMLFDYITKEEFAEIRAEEQYEIGLAEGEEKRKEKVARNMKIMGVAAEIITETTGFSPEKVETL